jgi:DNA repair protein RadC
MDPYPTLKPELRLRRVASPMTGYADSLACPDCGHAFQLTTEGQQWRITGPQDVADRLMARYGRLEQEHLVVLSLTTKNMVKDETVVYIGNVSAAVVRIGELFTEPIRQRASAMILVHSHPSGDPTPSPDDLHLTAEALAASRLLDLPLLDHLVISASSYVSLRDRGVVFSR